MLSPATWHRYIPKDPAKNVQMRLAFLQRASGDRSFQKGMRAIFRDDLLAFVNLCCWQFNPKEVGGEVGPFITWDCQDGWLRGLLNCIECHCHEEKKPHQHDMVWEKSREMGATWLFLLVAVWLGLFHKNKSMLMISRSAPAVDSDDKSLFWKIDFILDRLPNWLKGNVTRRKMYFGFDDTHSTLTGEASTGKAGVGGRATVMFIDEFSQIDEDKEVLHRTSDTAGCRLFNGTHLGLDTAFFSLTQRPDIRKQVMHWTEHPAKREGLYRYDPVSNQIDVLDKGFEFPASFKFVYEEEPIGGPHPGLRSPWYDAQFGRKNNDKRAVAMDLDINPQGTVSQVFDAQTIRHLLLTVVREPYWEGELDYDRDTGKPLDLMRVKGGKLKLWLNPVDGRVPLGKYAMGGDLAHGTGSTPTCFSVVNVLTGEKVCEYVDARITPDESSKLAVALCWLFKDENGEGAAFAWEHAGPGIRFGQKVMEAGYRNVYYRTNEHRLVHKRTDTPGWVPTADNKDVLLKDYSAALSSRRFVNRSEPALKECLKFRWNVQGHAEHGEEAADDGSNAKINHGDRTIADALAYKMAKQGLPLREQAREEIQVGSLAWRRQLHNNQRREAETWA